MHAAARSALEAHMLTWLGVRSPIDKVSFAERRALLVGSDFDLASYFRQLRQRHGFIGLPTLAPPLMRHNQPPRLHFMGDSVALEMAASCRLLNWTCTAEGVPFLCGPSFASPNCSALSLKLGRLVETHDVVVLAHGMWYMLPAHNLDASGAAYLRNMRYKGSFRADVGLASGGVAPALMWGRSWEALLAAVQRAVPPSGSGKAVVICTPMPLDMPMMLSDPWKPDWDRLYPSELLNLWAEHAALVAARRHTEQEGLMVLPLWLLARRYQGLRCDGMHFGSMYCARGARTTCSVQDARQPLVCSPNLGAYHGVLAAVVEAALRGWTLTKEIEWLERGSTPPRNPSLNRTWVSDAARTHTAQEHVRAAAQRRARGEVQQQPAAVELRWDVGKSRGEIGHGQHG